MSMTITKRIVKKKDYDIIVCGGGVAGVAAAVTASKQGDSVLLIEKSAMLGGLATQGLINLFVPMCNGRGKQIIFGLCEKWVRLSARYSYDTIPDVWKNGEPQNPTSVRYSQRYSPYIFALQLTEEIQTCGADLLFDCMACDPVMEGNVCKGIITESKGGTEYYGCKILIDVTGDCDVLRRGGVPVVVGENFYTYLGKMISLDTCKKAIDAQDISKVYERIAGGNINLFGDRQPSDMPRWSGLTSEEVSDYLVKNQLHMLNNIKGDDRNARDIAMLPFMPQFRTTACLKGDYTLSIEDAYKHFDDSICAINDFEHRDHLFEVPLRTITRRDYPNMLTAGRSASGSGYGWDLLRVIPPAILTGQAAAVAASLALREQVAVASVDICKLHNALEKENIMVHFPDEYLPEDRTVCIHGKNTVEIAGGHF